MSLALLGSGFYPTTILLSKFSKMLLKCLTRQSRHWIANLCYWYDDLLFIEVFLESGSYPLYIWLLSALRQHSSLHLRKRSVLEVFPIFSAS